MRARIGESDGLGLVERSRLHKAQVDMREVLGLTGQGYKE